MAFPYFNSSETCPVDVDRTFTADTYGDYTDACVCLDLTISYTLPASHYLDCMYVGIHGASTNSGNIYGLWIDSDWTGTNSGTYYMMRLSMQGASTPPTAFMQFQSAGTITYLFVLDGIFAPWGSGGTDCTASGSTDPSGTIAIKDPTGTAGYIRVWAAK